MPAEALSLAQIQEQVQKIVKEYFGGSTQLGVAANAIIALLANLSASEEKNFNRWFAPICRENNATKLASRVAARGR